MAAAICMLAVVMPCNALDMSGNGSIMPNDTTITAANDKQISDTINKVVSAADSVSMKMLSAMILSKTKSQSATGAHGARTPKGLCGLPL